ncbi:spermidine synthase [Halobellus ordinarius]|uniref:spermidine synthase n=1 Tax=Halobellus ordinarius TaxID=3075120 RepID=UPI00288028D9|nr:fused MFS/spermidine synthase [Halobellus sp. ZY16]
MHSRLVPDRLPTRPETAVFVSGVTSMGLEILAGRILAPEFGNSIYTWGGIIGVFLAALSLGYHRGGKRAASNASHSRLVGVFLVTALYVAGVVLFGDLVVQSTDVFPLPSQFASLPAITILFGPPTYLLGYVSPYAAELAGGDVGATAGHVYAVGTVGSIVGAFATTYVLVPTLSVPQIGLVLGLSAVSAAAAVGAPDLRGHSGLRVGVVAVALVAAAAVGGVGPGVTGDTVYGTQTAYQELRVVDRDDTRTLYLDGQPHSAMDREDPTRHVFEYTRYFHAPLLFTDDVDRVLFVGGGGFTGPRIFHERYPNVTVDVVELDPAVVDAADEYFGVPDSPRMNVHVGGGRQYLAETNRTYDVIVLDAYRKDTVPFQLTTVEFMRLAAERLDDDGVLLANIISAPSGPASEFYRAEYKTMERVFPRVYSFPTAGGPVVQNIEVVATKDETLLTREQLQARNEKRDIGIDLSADLRSYRRDEPTDDVPVLRDDRAPVDSLLDGMVGQRYVRTRANESGAENATPTN